MSINDSSTGEVPPELSTKEVIAASVDLFHAWMELFQQEIKLARRSFLRLVFGSVVLVGTVITCWLSLTIGISTLFLYFTESWKLTIFLNLVLQLTALGVLLYCIKKWWSAIGMPRSRYTLSRMMERFL